MQLTIGPTGLDAGINQSRPDYSVFCSTKLRRELERLVLTRWDECPCQEPQTKRTVPRYQPPAFPKKPGVFSKLFAEVAKASREVGRAWLFALALGTVVVWAISGPFFGFSDTWQLVINTGTTIVTFLMVFLIQNSQNRDSAAIQVKLDELIRVSKANNAFMGLEHLTDEELEDIEGKNEGRAKAVLEARKASEDAKHKLRVIDGDG
jgi:low affinity Fe/Cu permease